MGLFRFFGSGTSDEQAEEITPELNRKSLAPKQDIADAHRPPSFDAVSVLEASGVDAAQRERVDRTLELLNALPADASPQLRKNIVEASLKAFDISIKAIVESAGAELSAFDKFIASGHDQLAKLKAQSLARIAELEAEIASIKKQLEIATSDQASLDQATVSAMDRVRPIVGFFGAPPKSGELKVSNDKNEHPPSIIIDENLLKAG